MSRPTDWSPIGFDRDPVPGDPLTVSGAASTFQEVANEIKKAETHLRSISVNGQGETIHKIRQKCDDLAGRIQKAHKICDGVDDALKPYVEVLETAQEKSLKELERAEAHRAAASRVRQRQESVRTRYNASREPQERDELRCQFHQLQVQANHETEQLYAARRRLQAVIDERNSAAKTAAGKLRGVLKDSGLKDSWWDKVCGIVRSISKWLEKIKPWLDKIAAILSVVSVVLAFIPGLPVVAAVLMLVSRGAMILSSGVSLMVNGRKVMDGEMGWGEFARKAGMDVLGLVGAGRSAKGVLGALKGSRKGLTAAAQHIKDSARWTKRANGLRGANPVRRFCGKVRDWVTGEPFKQRVLDEYGYRLWRNGTDKAIGSGINYAIIREGANDAFKGARRLAWDQVKEACTEKDEQKAAWECYYPGKLKKALKPLPEPVVVS